MQIIIINVQIAVDIYYNLMLWTKFRPVVVSSADTFLGGDEEGGNSGDDDQSLLNFHNFVVNGMGRDFFEHFLLPQAREKSQFSSTSSS